VLNSLNKAILICLFFRFTFGVGLVAGWDFELSLLLGIFGYALSIKN